MTVAGSISSSPSKTETKTAFDFTGTEKPSFCHLQRALLFLKALYGGDPSSAHSRNGWRTIQCRTCRLSLKSRLECRAERTTDHAIWLKYFSRRADLRLCFDSALTLENVVDSVCPPVSRKKKNLKCSFRLTGNTGVRAKSSAGRCSSSTELLPFALTETTVSLEARERTGLFPLKLPIAFDLEEACMDLQSGY